MVASEWPFSEVRVQEPPNSKFDWLKVRLTLGSSVFLWVYFIKQYNEDVLEYKTRNGLECTIEILI
ncbi:PREDICTED: NADH dehydrogenase [ubiquinone] 1 subunit C1, mitochondrial-like [Chrysochloris asiatica]|uniref:NADH dehydrogenase [ubiquinone] 1 subunit C1, mitochondrial n=1 Tax=Chrysochloris asiatica TaxID=185453 RepID=A0A9B0TVX2_CHRAS|nr:PREDICTED: NADH dehydrogenase [ubiquinone] 1 subunit C1, mitochondrial-like [Chrysochloris asiatica]